METEMVLRKNPVYNRLEEKVLETDWQKQIENANQFV